MITGDYQDLIWEISVKAEQDLSIQLDNVDVIPGEKNSFQFSFPSNYSHTLGKFNRQYPYWMNYHWRVFRAKDVSGNLIIQDWKSKDNPGGTVGQELMVNFIEIQPYLDR